MKVQIPHKKTIASFLPARRGHFAQIDERDPFEDYKIGVVDQFAAYPTRLPTFIDCEAYRIGAADCWRAIEKARLSAFEAIAGLLTFDDEMFSAMSGTFVAAVHERTRLLTLYKDILNENIEKNQTLTTEESVVFVAVNKWFDEQEIHDA